MRNPHRCISKSRVDVAKNRPEQVSERLHHPHFKLDTLAAISRGGEYDHGLAVYRSPCGVAQCLALNAANTAHIEYGTHKQLHQIMGPKQWAIGRGYSTLAVAICKTRLLSRPAAAKVNLIRLLISDNRTLVTLPRAVMWGIFGQA
jgi:hypothetical protein